MQGGRLMDGLTVALAIGLIVSLVFSEIFGLAAGGMIVPGYLALSLHHPASVVWTLACALATWAVVRQLGKHMIIYGRRRIVLMLLFGFLCGSLVRAGLAALAPATGAEGASGCLGVIGFIIPGLIALWFDRQGVLETVGSLATSATLVRLVLILIGTEFVL
jgi:poly-gamma-glutamate biosynthesis protein PgsC/CapC